MTYWDFGVLSFGYYLRLVLKDGEWVSSLCACRPLRFPSLNDLSFGDTLILPYSQAGVFYPSTGNANLRRSVSTIISLYVDALKWPVVTYIVCACPEYLHKQFWVNKSSRHRDSREICLHKRIPRNIIIHMFLSAIKHGLCVKQKDIRISDNFVSIHWSRDSEKKKLITYKLIISLVSVYNTPGRVLCLLYLFYFVGFCERTF